MPRSLALAALLALAVPAAASAVPCSRLKGKVVARNAQVKVVRQHVHTRSEKHHDEFVGRRFVGCARGGGRAHVLTDAGTDYLFENGRRQSWFAGSTVVLQPLAGRFLYTRESYASNDAQGENGVVYDVATGRHRAVWSTGDFGGDEGRPLAWRLDSAGVWAGVLPSVDDHVLVASADLGRRKRLDRAPAPQLPASSLTLTGTVVGWTVGGVARSADLG